MSGNLPGPLPAAGLTKSSKIWYDDGTVVIQVESTLFRVYKGVLQRHSSIFHDVFALPQPADAPTFEGVPLVELQDVATDMELFLLVLHELKWGYSANNPSKLDFKQSLVVAQLSAKYCVDGLNQWAAARFKALYDPSSLENWLVDRIQHGGEWVFEDDGASLKFQLDYINRSDIRPWDHITAVNMARRLNLPQLLPVAFYAAATSLDLKEILEGAKPWKICRNVDINGLTSARLEDDPPVRFEDSKDALICAIGQRRLSILFNPLQDMINVLITSACDKIRGGNQLTRCVNSLRQLEDSPWPDANRPFIDKYEMDDRCAQVPHLRNLDDLVDVSRMCSNCRGRVELIKKGHREMVWKQLEEIFDLK